jgi:hypothetical protein
MEHVDHLMAMSEDSQSKKNNFTGSVQVHVNRFGAIKPQKSNGKMSYTPKVNKPVSKVLTHSLVLLKTFRSVHIYPQFSRPLLFMYILQKVRRMNNPCVTIDMDITIYIHVCNASCGDVFCSKSTFCFDVNIWLRLLQVYGKNLPNMGTLLRNSEYCFLLRIVLPCNKKRLLTAEYS